MLLLFNIAGCLYNYQTKEFYNLTYAHEQLKFLLDWRFLLKFVMMKIQWKGKTRTHNMKDFQLLEVLLKLQTNGMRLITVRYKLAFSTWKLSSYIGHCDSDSGRRYEDLTQCSWKNPESDGILERGGFSMVSGCTAVVSAPRNQEDCGIKLNKSDNPYRPPHSYKKELRERRDDFKKKVVGV